MNLLNIHTTNGLAILGTGAENSLGPEGEGLRQNLWEIMLVDAYFFKDQLADAGGTLCPTTLSRFPNIHKTSVIL